MASAFRILSDYNQRKCDLRNLDTNAVHRLLANVSNANSVAFGECRHMAVTDVATSNRTIHEATNERSSYFGRIFGDTYSAQHLVDMEKDKVGFGEAALRSVDLMQMVVSDGLTDTSKYLGLPSTIVRDESGTPISTTTRNVVGCPKLSADSVKCFFGDNLKVIDNAGNLVDQNAGSLGDYLMSGGVVVGVADMYTDSHRMAEVELYEPLPGATVTDSHAVMITGYGLAQRISDGEIIPFYNFQNNYGPLHIGEGRMRCDLFYYAVAPCFDGTKDFMNYMATSDQSVNRLALIWADRF